MHKICESCGEEMDGSEYRTDICDGCLALEDDEDLTTDADEGD